MLTLDHSSRIPHRLSRLAPLVLSVALVSVGARGFAEIEAPVAKSGKPMYDTFLDRTFPFVEMTMDFRGIAPSGAPDNLVPRGVVLPLEGGAYVCFDTELLRVAAVWRGDFVAPNSMAMLSYIKPLEKIGGGQEKLPTPNGRTHFATGLYPGWSRSGEETFADPRPRWIDPNELGRGPLDPQRGEWCGIDVSGATARLDYTVEGTVVSERFVVESRDSVDQLVRLIDVGPVEQPLSLVVHDAGPNGSADLSRFWTPSNGFRVIASRYVLLDVPASPQPQELAVAYSLSESAAGPADVGSIRRTIAEEPVKARWAETAATEFSPGAAQSGYAVDELRVPYPNPWSRRIRMVDIAFRDSGEAVVLTFDGDVYAVNGLGKEGASVVWRRIAAGIQEPQSLILRGDDLFVFSRNGIERLIDTNGDGEIDYYAMFCNRFVQSANTRDYALSIGCLPDGSFIIVKGGIEDDQAAPQSGYAYRVLQDGSAVEPFAHGLRNAYIEIHPETGLITASDQQGHWVPATPLLIIEKGKNYGFQPSDRPSPAPVQEPLLWIPHEVAQSGIGQVWASDPRFGPLKDSLLYIDHFKPGLVQIKLDDLAAPTQAVGTPLPAVFETPLLNGAVNPIDGRAYFVGMQVFGSDARRLEGMARLRMESNAPKLVAAENYAEGVKLTFSEEIDPSEVAVAGVYAAKRWNYRRTKNYGSGQYTAEGEIGQDVLGVRAVKSSVNGYAVFVALEDLRPAMQFELAVTFGGQTTPLYFTPAVLEPFDAVASGFESIDFRALQGAEDAGSSKAAVAKAADFPRPLLSAASMYAASCASCHGQSLKGGHGPSLVDGDWTHVRDDESMVSVIRDGLPGTLMPGWGTAFDAETIREIVGYIREMEVSALASR